MNWRYTGKMLSDAEVCICTYTMEGIEADRVDISRIIEQFQSWDSKHYCPSVLWHNTLVDEVVRLRT